MIESTSIARKVGHVFEGRGSVVFDILTDVVVRGVLHAGIKEIQVVQTSDRGRRAGPEFPHIYDHVNNATGFNQSVFNTERNRLLSAWSFDSETGTFDHHTNYAYDAAGFATVRNGIGLTWTAGGWPESVGGDTFRWDSEGTLIEMSRGGVDTTFRYGGLVRGDAAGQPQELDLGFVRVQLDSAGRLYRHEDFRRNTKLVTDENGEVATHYSYMTYGNEFAAVPILGEVVDDRTFAQGLEIGNDLVLLGARLYDSRTGYFLSPDPVHQVVNQYIYAGGNPVEFWDPDGRHPARIVGPLLGFLLGLEAGYQWGQFREWLSETFDSFSSPDPEADGPGDGGDGGDGAGSGGGGDRNRGDGGSPSGAPVIFNVAPAVASGIGGTPQLGLFGFSQHPVATVLVVTLTVLGLRTRRCWSRGRLG